MATTTTHPLRAQMADLKNIALFQKTCTDVEWERLIPTLDQLVTDCVAGMRAGGATDRDLDVCAEAFNDGQSRPWGIRNGLDPAQSNDPTEYKRRLRCGYTCQANAMLAWADAHGVL